jgi:hypothetical protein
MRKVSTTLQNSSSVNSSGELLTHAGIAGVVIGSVAGLALVILGMVFLAHRLVRRKLNPRHEPQDQSRDQTQDLRYREPQEQSYRPQPQNQTGSGDLEPYDQTLLTNNYSKAREVPESWRLESDNEKSRNGGYWMDDRSYKFGIGSPITRVWLTI